MSDRALIAFETEDGTYDIHYSHNGAGELGHLLGILERYYNKGGKYRPGSDVSLNSIEGATGDTNLQRKRMASQAAAKADIDEMVNRADNEPAIRPDPEYTDVNRSDLADHINFPSIEAFLTVEEETAVTLYAPVWLEIGILQYLGEVATVETYELENPTMPNLQALENQPPEHRFEGDGYVEAASNPDSDAFETLSLINRGVAQMVFEVIGNADLRGKDDVQANVTYGSTFVDIDVDIPDSTSVPVNPNAGLLVKVPRKTMQDYTKKERREFQEHMQAMQTGRKDVDEKDAPDMVDELTAHFAEIDSVKRSADDARLKFSATLIGDRTSGDDDWGDAREVGIAEYVEWACDEYGDRVVTWTPKPYGDVANILLEQSKAAASEN